MIPSVETALRPARALATYAHVVAARAQALASIARVPSALENADATPAVASSAVDRARSIGRVILEGTEPLEGPL